jgi:hypothetical protein
MSAEHTCRYCDVDRGYYDMIRLVEGAENHCPLCALWLACLNTAVHDSIDNGDIERISIYSGISNLQLRLRGQEDLDLEMFRLEGRLK